MKSLSRIFVILLLGLAAAAFLLRDSPLWTPLEIQRGLEARDVARVERVVDLERFAASATAAMGSVVADQMGVAGDDAGSRVLGALVQAGAEVLGHSMAREAAQEMRRGIADGNLERRIGPFIVNDGLAAFGPVHITIEGATLELKGTCDGTDATLVLELERIEDGPFGGHPHRHVLVGVDAASGKRLARLCQTPTPSSSSSSSTSSPSSPSKPKTR